MVWSKEDEVSAAFHPKENDETQKKNEQKDVNGAKEEVQDHLIGIVAQRPKEDTWSKEDEVCAAFHPEENDKRQKKENSPKEEVEDPLIEIVTQRPKEFISSFGTKNEIDDKKSEEEKKA